MDTRTSGVSQYLALSEGNFAVWPRDMGISHVFIKTFVKFNNDKTAEIYYEIICQAYSRLYPLQNSNFGAYKLK